MCTHTDAQMHGRMHVWPHTKVNNKAPVFTGNGRYEGRGKAEKTGYIKIASAER